MGELQFKNLFPLPRILYGKPHVSTPTPTGLRLSGRSHTIPYPDLLLAPAPMTFVLSATGMIAPTTMFARAVASQLVPPFLGLWHQFARF